ncbi:aKG-HExxH-type peptide beta-hydroxylase [Streptomyces griseosporeus]|uniref:aKG-HExxH-type peptide beta-hydroxylase n=1 Tax=Streptomyces griseosporeus TaxID=1910 RepID=UPI0037A91BA8
MTLRAFRLDVSLLEALARGGGGAGALRLLADAEYGRRLLLLRAVLDRARERGGAVAAEVAGLFAVLAQARRAAPEATRRVLTHPSVGPRLVATWQALGDPDPGPVAALPLAEVTASAALAAGLPAEVTLTAQGPGAVLPGLGAAVLPDTPPGSPVRLRAGVLEAEGGGSVRVWGVGAGGRTPPGAEARGEAAAGAEARGGAAASPGTRGEAAAGPDAQAKAPAGAEVAQIRAADIAQAQTEAAVGAEAQLRTTSARAQGWASVGADLQGEGEARWWALRVVWAPRGGGGPPGGLGGPDGAGRSASAVLLDDVDPVAAAGAPRVRLGDGEVRAWQAGAAAALRLLRMRHPGYAGEVAAGLRALVPLPADPGAHRSGSAAERFGGVTLTRPASPLTFAETLVHETQHSKLVAVMHLVDLLDTDAGEQPLLYAPWRDDPRPPAGLLHGTYAFLSVARFWSVEAGAARDPERRYDAQVRCARWREAAAEAAGTLLAHADVLTGTGRRFVTVMDAALTGLRRVPLPAAAVREARRQAEEHRTRWRASLDRTTSPRA